MTSGFEPAPHAPKGGGPKISTGSRARTALVSRALKIWRGRPLIHSIRIQTIKGMRGPAPVGGRSEVCTIPGHGPHGASRGDFFLSARDFQKPNAIRKWKSRVLSTAGHDPASAIWLFISEDTQGAPGGGQKSGRFGSGPAASGQKLFRRIPKNFFLGSRRSASGEPVAGGRGLSSRVV
jgi:hypothetical protein